MKIVKHLISSLIILLVINVYAEAPQSDGYIKLKVAGNEIYLYSNDPQVDIGVYPGVEYYSSNNTLVFNGFNSNDIETHFELYNMGDLNITVSGNNEFYNSMYNGDNSHAISTLNTNINVSGGGTLLFKGWGIGSMSSSNYIFNDVTLVGMGIGSDALGSLVNNNNSNVILNNVNARFGYLVYGSNYDTYGFNVKKLEINNSDIYGYAESPVTSSAGESSIVINKSKIQLYGYNDVATILGAVVVNDSTLNISNPFLDNPSYAKSYLYNFTLDSETLNQLQSTTNSDGIFGSLEVNNSTVNLKDVENAFTGTDLVINSSTLNIDNSDTAVLMFNYNNATESVANFAINGGNLTISNAGYGILCLASKECNLSFNGGVTDITANKTQIDENVLIAIANTELPNPPAAIVAHPKANITFNNGVGVVEGDKLIECQFNYCFAKNNNGNLEYSKRLLIMVPPTITDVIKNVPNTMSVITLFVLSLAGLLIVTGVAILSIKLIKNKKTL